MGQGVIHFEILGEHPKKLQSFYAKQFGWNVDANNPMAYGVVDTKARGKSKGINGGIAGPPPSGPKNGVMFYIQVPAINGALAKIEKAGGKAVMPRTVIPGMVTFAQFLDPAGNAIGLVESRRPPAPKAPKKLAKKRKGKKKKAKGKRSKR